ncbi:hypothetical protein B0O99DRAFT_599180 [Bisporella sp. PMI_857]|nr:hypothetical protein B0O99DRAFT_599180 [Bisporella sp. PMI_857]
MYKAMIHAYKHQNTNNVNLTPGSPFKYMRRAFEPHIGVQGNPKEKVGYCLGTYRTLLPGNLSTSTINMILLGKSQKVVFGLQSAGVEIFHQNGAHPGAFGALHLVPSIDSAVFVLANSLPLYDVCDYVGQLVLAILLGEHRLPDYLSLAKTAKSVYVSLYDKIGAFLDMGKTNTPPDFPLTSYEGGYYNKRRSIFPLSLKKGSWSCLAWIVH